MFNTARLQVVLEIARHGTIVAAAEQLRLSPSAVSHQLAALEQEAGVALVDRGPRSLRLTVAGQRLADYAQQIIDLMSAARDELSAHGDGRRGLLRIGFFATAGTELLPRALSSFTADHPQVELALILGQPSDLLPQLNQGELDLVVVFDHPLSPAPEISPGAKVSSLMIDPQLVVLPAGHPLAGRRLRLTDLADEPWITTLGVQGEVSVLELAARAEGFQPRIRCRSDHYEVVLGLVRAGVGVALVPSLGLRDPGEVAVQPLAHANLHREIGVALRPGNPNPVVGSFVDRLTDAAAGLSQELMERWPRVPASRSTAVPHRRSSPTAARSAPDGKAATTA
ncbi:LysR family transcriptional regulator [Micromonospora sp. LH3U1]|uniref:LysR family transcriptional regulator n=1 Tax=Micromonospora sp. LH3U1 TaxID=3018339 RepID=UPI00234A0E47|nr:LysR family transcriptional regulator [Micromonospora sp. LH3U1]WCN83276.1 LysR substrate-binding domain-containing protein [Micromonospora sp. LH3U1]